MPGAAAVQYAEVVQTALNRGEILYALRIPGRTEYLAALDEAVQQAVRGEKSAEEALERRGQEVGGDYRAAGTPATTPRVPPQFGALTDSGGWSTIIHFRVSRRLSAGGR